MFSGRPDSLHSVLPGFGHFGDSADEKSSINSETVPREMRNREAATGAGH